MKGLSDDPPLERGSMVYLTLVVLVATLGGLLFGYDTAVIAGAIGFLQTHFELTPAMKGFAASSALAGCVLGVILAGPISDRFGRRRMLVLAAIMFLVSAIGTALPRTLMTFVVFRFLGGVGVGAASMTSPMYIAEISPARIRGRMVSLNQLAIVFGMLVVYFVNYFIGSHGTSLNHQTASRLVKQLAAQVVLDDGTAAVVESRIAEQIESYRHTVDQNAIHQMAAALEEVIEDSDADRSQYLSTLNRDLGLKQEQWDSSAICRAVAVELSEYGLKLDKEDVDPLARHLARQCDGELDIASLARGHMAYLLREELDAQHVTASSPPEIIAASLIEPLRGLGAESWNVRYGWRWMFGSEALPAVALLLLLCFIPESPRWLTEKGRVEKARHILTRVDGSAHAEGELNEIQTALAREPATLREIVAPGLRVALLIGVVLAVLQQITGINVMLYYGPEIFKNAGQSIDTSLVWTIAMGGCMVLFTCVAIWTVDKLGRKPLMIAGATGMGLCLIASGVAFCVDRTGLSLLIFILGYIAFFSLSVGPVTWVILSEIFPTKIRGRAMAVATLSLWIANFVVSQSFPMLDENPWLLEKFNHGFPFFVYGGFCVVLVVFMTAAVPETKGKTLEEIEQRWCKRPTERRSGT